MSEPVIFKGIFVVVQSIVSAEWLVLVSYEFVDISRLVCFPVENSLDLFKNFTVNFGRLLAIDTVELPVRVCGHVMQVLSLTTTISFNLGKLLGH